MTQKNKAKKPIKPDSVEAKVSKISISWFLWCVSLALWLPTLIPYACHFSLPSHPDMAEFQCDIPTGFIQSDQHYYMINASKHFDDDGFHLFYGQPFSPNADTPRIYFQPQILVLGLLRKASGWEPATVFLSFGFVAGVICIRVALELFRELFGLQSFSRWLAAVLWIWGGGLLTLIGSARYIWTKQLDDLFFLDPAGGVWFLNLGRNLIFPMEAYYHAVFLGAIYQLIRRRFWLSYALTVLLSISHPFTGIELILVILSWGVLEKWWVSQRAIFDISSKGPSPEVSHHPQRWPIREVPWQWIAALVVLATAHLGYYFLFLGFFPEHRSLQAQWTLDWTYEIQHFLPAYFLVGLFAFWGIRNLDFAQAYFSVPRHRLFLVWFFVAFALANHEFALKPSYQPLHFTRGYVWIPLFLMGGTAIVQWIEWMMKNRGWRWFGIPFLVSLFLMDNVLFLTTFHFRSESARPEVYIQQSYLDLAELLNQPEQRGALIVCPNLELSYWLLLYCPVRAWCSHATNTPFVAQRIQEVRELVIEGKFLPAWNDRNVVLILPKYIIPEKYPLFYKMLAMKNVRWIQSNPTYIVFRYTPPLVELPE